MLFLAFGNTIQAQEEIFTLRMRIQRGPDSKQKINSTRYPFDGTLDSSRIYKDNENLKVPLNFSIANFYESIFTNISDFSYAHFSTISEFEEAQFNKLVQFNSAQFHDKVNFYYSKFHSFASFFCSQFFDVVEFVESEFRSTALFDAAYFQKLVDYSGARFNQDANFRSVNFAGDAVFEVAHFYALAYFGYCNFNGRANFNTSQFFCSGDFYSATFYNEADFRDAGFKNLSFERAEIKSKMFLGSQKGQKYDFTRTIFSSNTKLILCEIVDLNIQQEKIRYVFLCDTLNYNLKSLIIENLKNLSFSENKKAQFELEYIFAKSTMFQEPGDKYIKNRWYKILKWPKWFFNALYYITMGLGYKPFRLIYWIFGFITLFATIYFVKFGQKINSYIMESYSLKSRTKNLQSNYEWFDTLLNCTFFSVAILLTVRLKGNILTFFDTKEKKIILTQWLVGLLIYLSFLTFSKSGSILNTFKNLFVE